MSDQRPLGSLDEPATSVPKTWRGRLRRFFLRHLPLSVGALLLLITLIAVGVYFVASTSAFENVVRERLIASTENLTGGRTEIASFHWRLLHLEAEADGMVIHGLEDSGEAPYARIERLRVRISIFGILSPHVLLRDLEVTEPAIHIIAYPDGSTNQPRPRKQNSSTSASTLFDLQADHIVVKQGLLHYDNRAASFDYKDRYAPLDFEAQNISISMHYSAPSYGSNESYRVDASLADLDLSRTVPRSRPLPVHGALQLTADLERSRFVLRKLEITSRARGIPDRNIEITGVLDDFNDPHWKATAAGDFDMRLLDSTTGYSDAPEGLARLNLTAAGGTDAFQIDGSVHVDDGSYIGVGIFARGVTLDGQVHANNQQLQITQIVAKLRQGGQIEGSVELSPWLPVSKSRRMPAVGTENTRVERNVLVREPKVRIPVNGKVTANLEGPTLDTILDIVSVPQFRRLGLDARVTGPAVATWTNGDGNKVAVTAGLDLSPSAQSPSGEAPTSGRIDGTYTQSNGAVDLRKLELHLPASNLEAHGQLGAYPVASKSFLTVDFETRNLGEFDQTLRDLGLERSGRKGTAALPVALSGKAEFLGTWAGSLVKPHLAGDLKANQLSIEMPATQNNSSQTHFIHLDSVGATGSYSPSQISIERAQLLHGNSKIAISGTLDASQSTAKFDRNSLLRAHADVANVDFADVWPFITAVSDEKSHVTGSISGRLVANGPLHSPDGSFSMEMAECDLYGEHASDLRLQGSMADDVLKIASASFNAEGGEISGAGMYNLNTKAVTGQGHGTGIDIARVGWVRTRELDAAGILSFNLSGSGSADDPQIEAHATINPLVFAGQRFGIVDLTAHTASHTLHYNVGTRLDAAEFVLRGQTTMNDDYTTHAEVDFSRFNIGALLSMAHVENVSGQSALAGTITLDGPIAHPQQMRGEVSLQQLAFNIAGVSLQSDGGGHATLNHSVIHLDPLHITGADTDIRAQGDLSLQGARQLNATARGTVNLKLVETLDRDLTASGETTFQVEAHGPLQQPNLEGRVDIENGSIALDNFPNGLSQLHGSMEFTQNRLEVRSLTAISGGGQLSVGGFLAYQHGVYADLSVTGKQVRLRYPQGITSLADANFQLQGLQSNLLLSGDVLITRFSASPDLDLAALAAQASSAVQTIAPPDAASNHVRLDVRVSSSPQLSFQNAFAQLAGDVDLHLRGTVASPSLLGTVTVTQGSAMIAGTRYDLQRGNIAFTNPVRIEPNIDFSATARVEDYDISLDLHGSPQKLSVAYRSDPPLPEADVVALLALGHTANQQRLYTQQQEQAISNPSTDALLGGALNATVSNRVQKLFGAGSVKVDPNYLGAFGNSTSRVTVAEQLGRSVTLTYATDVNTTSQQLLQAEIAINRHVSLVVARDESGVFSMVVKATRRFR